jgi:hypothetical protein
METLIWVLLIVLLYLFFFWDPKSQYDIASDKKQSIAPNIIQAVIEAIQKDKPDEVPLETLFVNSVGNNTYSCSSSSSLPDKIQYSYSLHYFLLQMLRDNLK